jgi:hypothetical protein
VSSNGRHKRLAARKPKARPSRRPPMQIRCRWDGALFLEDSSTSEERERRFRKRLKRWNRRHKNGQPREGRHDLGGGMYIFDDDRRPERWPDRVLITGIG